VPNRTTPIDGQPWPFADFIRDSPLWAPSGVVGSPAAAANVGDLALSFDIVTGTSVTPKLALGRGRSRGGRYERTFAPWSSGMSGTAPQDGSASYPLNTGSNPRRDRIVLRRDNALQAVYPLILIGTPAATPSAQALLQEENGRWDAPLHSWTLPGGSSTAPANITDERHWISPDGDRAAPASGIVYASAFSENTVSPLRPIRTNSGLVTLAGLVTNNQVVNNPVGTWFTLPVGYRPTTFQVGLAYVETIGVVAYSIDTSGVVAGIGYVVGSGAVPTPRYWSINLQYLASPVVT
jgi:hypothetical protein